MTFHARIEADGSFILTAAMTQGIGARPGDTVAIEHDARALVVRREPQASEPLGRLREAMRGYSVDRFRAERHADTGE